MFGRKNETKKKQEQCKGYIYNDTFLNTGSITLELPSYTYHLETDEVIHVIFQYSVY